MPTSTPKQVSRQKNDPPSSTSVGFATEKNEMVNLNNRMAVYVDKVRSLENENLRLHLQCESLEESTEQKIKNMKSLYETEINSTLESLNALSSRHAALELSHQNLQAEHDHAVERSETCEAKSKRMELELNVMSNELNEKRAICNEIIGEKNEKEKLIKTLQNELAKFSDHFNNEKLSKVELENMIQTLKEKIEFKDKLYEEEIKESRKSKHVISVSEHEVGSKEEVIQEHIQNIREQLEADNEEFRENLEQNYNEKLSNLRKKCDGLQREKIQFEEKSTINVGKYAKVKQMNKALENECATKTKMVSELEDKMKMVEESKRITVDALVVERDELRLKIEQVEKESMELQECSLHLHREIETYKNLLEGEEMRLNISPSPAARSPSSRLRRKRKRIGQSEANSEQTAKRTTVTSEATSSGTNAQQNGRNAELDDLFHDRQSGNSQDTCILM